MIDLAIFSRRLVNVGGLKNIDKALAVMWWHERTSQGKSEFTPSDLCLLLKDQGLGSPNSTRMAQALRKSRAVHKGAVGYRLTQRGRAVLGERFEALIGDSPTPVTDEVAFLPEALYRDTRGYIERVCSQLNGCYHYSYHDAASVMMRRLVETLIIEAYENLGRQSEIRGADGNYLMLRGLVGRAVSNSGLSLGRESKRVLEDIKTLGDRAAHNRRFIARQRDLDALRDGVRVVFDELAAIAGLT